MRWDSAYSASSRQFRQSELVYLLGWIRDLVFLLCAIAFVRKILLREEVMLWKPLQFQLCAWLWLWDFVLVFNFHLVVIAVTWVTLHLCLIDFVKRDLDLFVDNFVWQKKVLDLLRLAPQKANVFRAHTLHLTLLFIRLGLDSKLSRWIHLLLLLRSAKRHHDSETRQFRSTWKRLNHKSDFLCSFLIDTCADLDKLSLWCKALPFDAWEFRLLWGWVLGPIWH